MTPAGPLSDDEQRKLRGLLHAFSQAYRLHGVFHLKFGTRRLPDSDSESVIDVYLTPRDVVATASATSLQSRHMQFLDSMVPATLSGYQYLVRIGEGPALEILETIPPVAS